MDVDEEIDGLDLSSPQQRAADYPLDDVMVRNETRTVSEIIKRIDRGRYVMNPDFQRDFVWSKEKQSKLIESCVMRIPLPVLYVAEAEDGRVTVVDGLQRLSTFLEFARGRLRLSLGQSHPLDGMTIDRLPISLRERIEDTQLTLYILDKNAPEAARLDIFERVNSGVALTRQQMRNALYNGPATKVLSELSQNAEFLKATGKSLKSQTMRDREAINRFAAFFSLGWQSYTTGDMDDFLARALRAMNAREFSKETLVNAFVRSMKRNTVLFGKHAFRKSLIYNSSDVSRSVINIALFDVLSVGFAKIERPLSRSDQEDIKQRVVRLTKESDFNHCITFSTNSTSQVRDRFRMFEKAMGEYMS